MKLVVLVLVFALGMQDDKLQDDKRFPEPTSRSVSPQQGFEFRPNRRQPWQYPKSQHDR
jgi:hypothetical protein